MNICEFYAKQYRNIEDEKLTFTKGVNLLFGGNANGKTNVLEGIYTFARGKSFRGAGDSEQVMFGKRSFSLSLTYETKEKENTLSYLYNNGKRERKKNGVVLDTLKEMIGSFRAVLFFPEHLELVKGGAGERRSFLDIALSQNDRYYLYSLSRYRKLLENRNALLKIANKTGQLDKDLLDSYSEGMAKEAAFLYEKRKNYIRKLSTYTDVFQKEMSGGKETLSLLYKSNIKEDVKKEDAKEYYLSLFTSSLDREIAAASTLFGIHHDDIYLAVDGKEAKLFASQGQQRTIVLAMKLAEGEVSHEEWGEYPVYLFDDVLSELDGARRAYLLDGVKDKQMILTACDKEEIGRFVNTLIEVNGGHYDISHR